MKKKILFTSLVVLVSALASCDRIRFTKNSNTTRGFDTTVTEGNTTTDNIEKRLVLSLNELDVNQYDLWDASLISVTASYYQDNVLIERNAEVITDYTLTLPDGTVLTPGYEFKTAGTFRITASKTGYTEKTFVLYVNEIYNRRESISITTNPTKTSYKVHESLDLSGMTVLYEYSYRDEDNFKHSTSRVLSSSDYKILYNGSQISNYVFNANGRYIFTISYTGVMKTCLAEISVTVSNIDMNDTAKDKDTTITDYWDNADNKSMNITFTDSKDTNSTDKGYYAPDEVELMADMSDLRERNAADWKYTPSTGDVPLLVIPVITPGDQGKATDENWEVINKAFFGNSDELYFESLRSYYYKASYGKLNFTGGVTDYFDPSTYSKTSSKYSSIDNYSESTVNDLVQYAVDWAVETYNIDLKNYDSNHDGYIDGVDLVYLHDVSSQANMPWWAYTSTTGATMSSFSLNANPIANTYFWTGIDFVNGSMCNSNSKPLSNADGDSHVLIHETGHMLGLADYYSYSYSGYDAVGGFDMMDQNTGDHNPYSKMQLGWIKPYVVTGNATISIDTFSHEDAAIVIPYDDKQFNFTTDGKLIFNPFDEYLIMDYYTKENLYAQSYDDSGYYMAHPTKAGAFLYHVDARLFTYDGNNKFSLPSDPDSIFTTNKTASLFRVISNSESGDASEQTYGFSNLNAADEIRTIAANKTYLNARTRVTNTTLFDDTNYTSFNLSDYADSFNYLSGSTLKKHSPATTAKATFNNGSSLSKSFVINSIN